MKVLLDVMPEKIIRSNVAVVTVVTCDGCGTKNRLRESALDGHYRCGACHAVIADPFRRPCIRYPRLCLSFGKGVMRYCGLALVVGLLALVLYPMRRADGDQRNKDPVRAEMPLAVAASPTSHLPGSYTATNEPTFGVQPPPTTLRIIAPPARFLEPELPVPANGTVHPYTTADRVAPFNVKSSYGSNYLVKLVDATTAQPGLAVFVRGGENIELKVPLGTFIVKYAAGEKWFGEKYLFGPETGYSRATDPFVFQHSGNQVSGYTITLYKVPNGNLKTESISPEDF